LMQWLFSMLTLFQAECNSPIDVSIPRFGHRRHTPGDCASRKTTLRLGYEPIRFVNCQRTSSSRRRSPGCPSRGRPGPAGIPDQARLHLDTRLARLLVFQQAIHHAVVPLDHESAIADVMLFGHSPNLESDVARSSRWSDPQEVLQKNETNWIWPSEVRRRNRSASTARLGSAGRKIIQNRNEIQTVIIESGTHLGAS
jgi:hypothetical protein